MNNEQAIIRFSESQKTIVLDFNSLFPDIIDNSVSSVSLTVDTSTINTYINDFLKNNIFRINSKDVLSEDTNDAKNIIITKNEQNDIHFIFTLSLDTFIDSDKIKDKQFNLIFKVNEDTQYTIIAYIDANIKNGYKFYDNETAKIASNMESFMLLRTNPKLTGNIKLVVDSDYNLYLDTFKVSTTSILNKKEYRHKEISADGNYPHDIYTIFNSVPTQEMYAVYPDSYDPHKNYFNMNLQIENIYEYGAEYNSDKLYSENMHILAPLYIGKNLPTYFAIFRTNRLISEKNADLTNTNIFKEMLKNSKTVKIFDLRNSTTIGKYLNNYQNQITKYFAGTCYLQFIEQDNDKNSKNYRQGKNTWKGISLDKGILTEKTETSYFANRILNQKDDIQEDYNMFLLNGYNRNNLIHPNIINLDFMFNDENADNFEIYNYFGLYLTENEFIHFNQIIKDYDNNYTLTYYNNKDEKIQLADTAIDIINNPDYADRLFFMTTLKDACNLYTMDDVNRFIKQNVVNYPYKNIAQLSGNIIEFNEEYKSFSSLKFDKPLTYGEHIKFISINNSSVTGNKENIILEIIASTDSRLKNTKDNINPYVSTNTPERVLIDNNFHNDYITNIYRLSFYTQDINDETKSASLEEQIKRIAACIKKFDNFIKVTNYNTDTLGLCSLYENTYIEHIILKSADDRVDEINKEISEINGEEDKEKINILNKQSDIDENIYYNNINDIKKFRVLFNIPDLYSENDMAFEYTGLELNGHKYYTISKFIKVKEYNNQYIYEIDKDITKDIKNISYPIISTINGYYPLTKIHLSDSYIQFTDANIKSTTLENANNEYICIINPFNVNKSLIISKYQARYINGMLNICQPMAASVSLMGINSIKDINMYTNQTINTNYKTSIFAEFNAGEHVYIDDSDNRLQKYITYMLIQGTFNNMPLSSNTIFTITDNKIIYKADVESQVSEIILTEKYIDFTEYTVIRLANYNNLDLYNYTVNYPLLNEDSYYIDKNNKIQSKLKIPFVPEINCQWKSNGTYFDHNSLLDVNSLINTYNIKGNFIENNYTPSDSKQYIKSKLNDIVNYNGELITINQLLLNNTYKSFKKYLIDNYKIDTAICTYNPYVQTLEFIYYGIKFVFKLTSIKWKNEIQLNEFNNYEIYVLNNYNASNKNEIYISKAEEFILIINHNYKTSEAYSIENIKNMTEMKNADYSAFIAPYNYNMLTSCYINNGINVNKSKKLYIDNDVKYVIENDLPIYESTQTNFKEEPRYCYFNTDEMQPKENFDIFKTGIIENKKLEENDSSFYFDSSIENITSLYDDIIDFKQLNTYFIKETNSDDITITYDEKIKKYIDSFNNNIDLYIISANNEYKYFDLNEKYQPITLVASMPNKIKYNYGIFEPDYIDIFEFNVFDNIADKLNIDTLYANTEIANVNYIKQYYYNKVLENNCICDYNYFNVNNRSILSTDWDNNIFRLYSNDILYESLDGYLLGIIEKMFFASKCLVLHDDIIKLTDWNIIDNTSSYGIDNNNVHTKAKRTFNINLNITKTFYNYIHTTKLPDNWNNIGNTLNIELYINNFISNTLMKIYNFKSDFDVILYKKYINVEKPEFIKNAEDLTTYSIDKNIKTEFKEINNEIILTITIYDFDNYQFYPIVKINKI